MLHVTCYMSHVTCQMLHVTCYMSHVTCHMLHVTRYMSHVTCHMLHVTCHMSNATNIVASYLLLSAGHFILQYIGRPAGCPWPLPRGAERRKARRGQG